MDTLWVLIDGNHPDIKLEKYTQSERIDPKTGEVLSTRYDLKERPLGINHVSVFPELEGKQCPHTEIEFSAKVHGANYFDGNNVNTIERAIDTIKKTCGIDLDVNQVLDTATVLRADYYTDLHLSRPTADYVKALRSKVPARDDLVVDQIKNQSVIFTRRKLTKKSRSRDGFYNKNADLDKKDNAPLLEVLPRPSHSIFRSESNVRTFAALRKLLKQKSGPPLLKDVLETSQNVPLERFNYLFGDPDAVISSGPKIIGHDLKEQRIYALHYLWILNWGTDIYEIKERVKNLPGIRWSRERPKLIISLDHFKGKEKHREEHELITEIRNNLVSRFNQ